jgi:hypothetical protein
MRPIVVCLAAVCALSAASNSQSTPGDDLWITGSPERYDRLGQLLFLPTGLSEALHRSLTGEVYELFSGTVRLWRKDGSGWSWERRLPAWPNDLVVDARGHAFVLLPDATVEDWNRSGTTAGTFRLPGPGRTGTVDETGRLWIGVENRPVALLSWRDPGSVVASVGLPREIGQVADLIVDGRAGGSHLFVIGGASPDLVEVDRQGRVVAVVRIGDDPGLRLRQMTLGTRGDLWIASSSGIWRHDIATGVTARFSPADTDSIALDGQGLLWAMTSTGLFKFDADGAATPSLVSTTRTSCDGSSALFLAQIVDRNGDFDGDGEPNAAEIAAGTNPFDPLSLRELDVDAGPIRPFPGQDFEIRVGGARGFAVLVFGLRTSPTPVAVPGLEGSLWLAGLLDAELTFPVPGRIALPVPAGLAPHSAVWMQVVRLPLGGGAPRLGELIGLRTTRPGRTQVVEHFDAATYLDRERSSGTWAQGVARPGQLGGLGRLGSFDPRLGRQVAPDVYEFDAVGGTFPAESTLFGRTETVTDGVFDFTDLRVPAGITVRFVGDRPIVLRVRGEARIDGVIDVRGADVPGLFDGRSPSVPAGQARIGADGQSGSPGGPGGGRGGAGADACLGIGTGSGTYLGRVGDDLRAPAASGYAGRLGGTGGLGGPLWPADGLSGSVTHNLFFSISGMIAAGGSGGGFLAPGGAGRVSQTFTGVASDASPAVPGGMAVPFVPVPVGRSSLEHFLVGGSGGGGGGSHPLNLTVQELRGNSVHAPRAWHAGAGGGGGGGALGLRVGGDLRVGVAGVIDARGGAAAESRTSQLGPPAPGGGGSGGSILLQVGGQVAQAGRLDLSGGSGGWSGNRQLNNQDCETLGGDGAPGFVRLETAGPPSVADLGFVAGPGALGAENIGALLESDLQTAQVSTWYGTGSEFPPLWGHYQLRITVDGFVREHSDEPARYDPATGPGLPVQLWFQGTQVDAAGQPVRAPGPWRSSVRELDLDDANAFRFMLLFDRSLSRDIAVDQLTVQYASR